MPAWYESVVLADSKAFTADETVEARVTKFRSPVVCVVLETLSGADDTVTIEFVGEAGTYEADSRTLSETGSYTVDVPQCDKVQLTSANGETYSAEVRANPD